MHPSKENPLISRSGVRLSNSARRPLRGAAVLAALALGAVLPGRAAKGEPVRTRLDCGVLGNPWLSADLELATGGRYPTADELTRVPQSCRIAASAAIKKWQAEDAANLRTLQNRACSALSGWVEKVPGTCSAGGPPPICKVDHWQYRPDIAMDAFRRNNARVREERRRMLHQAACQCWLDELIANDAVRPPRLQKIEEAGQAAAWVLPCVDNACPPGYRCMNGSCKAEAPAGAFQELAISKGKDFGQKHSAKYVIGRVLEILDLTHSRIAGFHETQAFSIGVGLLSSDELGSYYRGYVANSHDVESHLNDLQAELRVINSRRGTFSDEELARRVVRFNQLLQALRASAVVLDHSYTRVVTERELCPSCCYNVFDYQHRRLARYLADLHSSIAGIQIVGPLRPLPSDNQR